MSAVAPILALHCTMARGAAWRGVAGVLPEGQSLDAPDLPGHGAGPDWDGGPYLLACMTLVAPRLGPGEAPGMHLVGHSFGGVLALHLAARHPERVARLTLIEPVLFVLAEGREGHAAHARSFAPILDDIAQGRLAEAAEAFHGLWGAGAWSDIPARRRARMAATMPIIAEQKRTLFDPAAPETLTAIRAPVTLIEGGASHAVIAEIGDALEAELPVTARHRIAGAGHMAPLTHPGEVARALAIDAAT